MRTYNIRWERKQFTTRSADPTVVVMWTMSLDGHKFVTVTEFFGDYHVEFHMTVNTVPMAYWAERAQHLEDEWQQRQIDNEAARVNAEFNIWYNALTPEERHQYDSMELVDNDGMNFV